jgi:hypothetical protein
VQRGGPEPDLHRNPRPPTARRDHMRDHLQILFAHPGLATERSACDGRSAGGRRPPMPWFGRLGGRISRGS